MPPLRWCRSSLLRPDSIYRVLQAIYHRMHTLVSPGSCYSWISAACCDAARDGETPHSGFVRLDDEIHGSRFGSLYAVGTSNAIEGQESDVRQ